MKPLHIFLLLLTAPLAPLRAQLTYEKPANEITASLDDQRVVAKFPVKNSGSTSIAITKMAASCSCTVATLPKNTLAPGESSEIEAVFTTGVKRGTQIVTIAVATSDPQHSNTLLRLVVHIPEVLTVQPPLLIWNKDEPPEPKTITVTVAQKDPIHLLNVTSTSPVFEVKTKTVKDGFNYAISVKPKSTKFPAKAILNIETDCPIPSRQKYSAAAYVK